VVGLIEQQGVSVEGQTGRLKKAIISLFVVLSLGTVLYMNRPAALAMSPDAAYPVVLGDWIVQEYAFLAGLNNQWQMFGRQSRFNWWYVIKARYADGTDQVLPLPLQSERGFFQSMLFDFKEVKLQLNLYPRPEAREAYAYYLARQYPLRDGAPISWIIFDLQWQMLLSREDASRYGMYV
jgi:hypothetical protein